MVSNLLYVAERREQLQSVPLLLPFPGLSSPHGRGGNRLLSFNGEGGDVLSNSTLPPRQVYIARRGREGLNNLLQAISYAINSINIKTKNEGRMFLLFFSLLSQTLIVPCRSLSLEQPSQTRQRI